ncbi:hypothetical protein ACFLZ5_04715 [Thermodesulfobacteriota bacterium]
MNSNFFDLSKRKKRNLLSDLLDDKVSEGVVSKKELISLNKIISTTQQITASHKKQKENTKETTLRKSKKETDKKATLCLSKEILEYLDNVSNELRTIVPENLQSSVSRSQIVNQALTLILKDYKEKGKKSRLVRSIMQNN